MTDDRRAGSDRPDVPEASRAVVLYDRDCGFCRWSLAQLLRWDRERRLRPVPLQSPEAERLLGGLSPEQRLESAHVVLPDGSRYSGGDAMAPTLRLLPGGAPVAPVARAMSGLSRVSYRWVAGHRRLLGRPLSARAKARATARIDRHG